jgi:putative ABC transport system permease protein
MPVRNNQPPGWILAFFRWFCHPAYQEDIEGDLLERFDRRTKENGVLNAKTGLILDVLRLFRPGLMKSFLHSQNHAMFYNHFKIAWRSILKNQGFAILNVSGLALGIACCILIFSFVAFHKSYDRHHEQSERIYRFVTEQHRESINYTPAITNPLGKLFREEYDYAEHVARVCTAYGMLVRTGDDEKYEETIAFAEADYFRIFNLPLIKGNFPSVLKDPGSLILTESMAKKLFGDVDPVGQILELNGSIQATVTGVLADIPRNSDLQTQLYLSFNTVLQYNEWYASDDSWNALSGSMQCFVRLKEGVTKETVESAVAGYPERFRPGHNNRHVYKLQPLRDMHFSALYGGVISNRNLNVLMIIGFFLLITATFNFVNLATALNFQRTKEAGITQVLGATKKSIFWRFIAETSLILMASFAFAMIISWFALDYFNVWLGDRLRFDFVFDQTFALFLPLLFLFVLFAAGSYPGLRMAGIAPLSALKGVQNVVNKRGYSLRKSLIVAQFAISQLLVISMIVMMTQMKYAQGDLGFTRDAILTVPVGSNDEKLKSLKTQMLELSGVGMATSCYGTPASSESNWGTSVWFENRQQAEIFNIQFKGADEDYLKTFDLELVAGRNLLPGDTIREFIVNETFLRKMNIASAEEALGKTLGINGGRFSGPIVGVVRDFYDRSFREEKNAVCITTSLDHYNIYAVRLAGGNFQETIAAIESMWSKQYPEQLFSYEFLDDQLASFYETELVLVNVIKTFSFIAIFIGCLGLFGLISFMASNRKKEIAIRKVLGGSIANILSIFSMEFLKLIVVASLIAIPLGWWAMTKWLENFAYKISPEPWVFVLAIGVTVVFSAVTIFFRSLKAAVANPVDTLRSNS